MDFDRPVFIDEQAAADLAIGCLSEGHTWEALRDALQRTFDLEPWRKPLPPARVGGLRLG